MIDIGLQFTLRRTAPSVPGPPHNRGFTISLHTQHSIKFSTNVISPTQENLPDNTQHSQETDIHAPGRFESAVPASEGRRTTT
jgi:hypothetical protein